MDWHRQQDADSLSSSDRKIRGAYASGLAYVDRNNELSQAIINDNWDQHSVADRKSDHGDSVVLANVLRTNSYAHQPLPDPARQISPDRPSFPPDPGPQWLVPISLQRQYRAAGNHGLLA